MSAQKELELKYRTIELLMAIKDVETIKKIQKQLISTYEKEKKEGN